MIGAMATKAGEVVKAAVEDSLSEFSSFERIDPEGGSVIRGAFKQFHHGGEYAKGRGREFEVCAALTLTPAYPPPTPPLPTPPPALPLLNPP